MSDKEEHYFGYVIKEDEQIRKPGCCMQPCFKKLDPSKKYIIYKLIINLKPGAETPMKSHEGVVYELVSVIGPEDLAITRESKIDQVIARHTVRYSAGKTFLSVDSNLPDAEGKPWGFMHQLINKNQVDCLAEIITIAEK